MEHQKRSFEQLILLASVGGTRKGGWNPPSPDEIKKIRLSCNMTQAEFATFFRFDLKTVRNWEQGLSTPKGYTLVFLRLIEKHRDFMINKTEEIWGDEMDDLELVA
jgi:DNA-binding XRE family transcriptional regulator